MKTSLMKARKNCRGDIIERPSTRLGPVLWISLSSTVVAAIYRFEQER